MAARMVPESSRAALPTLLCGFESVPSTAFPQVIGHAMAAGLASPTTGYACSEPLLLSFHACSARLEREKFSRSIVVLRFMCRLHMSKGLPGVKQTESQKRPTLVFAAVLTLTFPLTASEGRTRIQSGRSETNALNCRRRPSTRRATTAS